MYIRTRHFPPQVKIEETCHVRRFPLSKHASQEISYLSYIVFESVFRNNDSTWKFPFVKLFLLEDKITIIIMGRVRHKNKTKKTTTRNTVCTIIHVVYNYYKLYNHTLIIVKSILCTNKNNAKQDMHIQFKKVCNVYLLFNTKKKNIGRLKCK